MKTRKDSADFVGLAEIRHGIGDGIVIFEPEQRRELFLIEFLDANAHVVRQHEVEEDLLPAVEARADNDLCFLRAFLAGESGKRVGDVS